MTPLSNTAQAVTLQHLAMWHRKQSDDYLNHSSQSMRQHEQAAEELEAEARNLLKEQS